MLVRRPEDYQPERILSRCNAVNMAHGGYAGVKTCGELEPQLSVL